jgi:hypothetical protein
VSAVFVKLVFVLWCFADGANLFGWGASHIFIKKEKTPPEKLTVNQAVSACCMAKIFCSDAESTFNEARLPAVNV